MNNPLQGNKGGGKGSDGGTSTSTETRNTLYSTTVARILDAIGEGPIVGLADQDNPEKSVYFDGVPLMNADGTLNFEGVTVQQRFGYTDQTHIEGFGTVTTQVNVSDGKAEFGNPKESPPILGAFDSLRVKVLIPTLTKLTNKGDLKGNSVTIELALQSDGGSFLTKLTKVIEGKNTAPFERDFTIPLREFTDGLDHTYVVRLTRITEDFDDDSRLTGDVFLSSVNAIADQKIAYADTSLIGLHINGYEFGDQILRRNYDIRGMILDIPSNYDNDWTSPTFRQYTGIWDGTFKRGWTDNPAWITYNLLSNERWGLGRTIRPDLINKWKLYAIGQYCDELVNDGFGGTEPRFTFNTIVTQRRDAYAMISLFVSVFQGMLFWGTGTVEFGQDSPTDPSKVFTPANVIDGIFNRATPSLKAKYSVAHVTWLNPDKGYEPEIEIVEEEFLVARFGVRINEVIAFACTSRGQARRYGAMLLDNDRYGAELISFTAGLDGAEVRPSDVVQINDPSHSGQRMGGRIAGTLNLGGTYQVTLDQDVDLTANGGVGYTIHAMLPDGTLESLGVQTPNPLVATNVIETDGLFTTAPLDGAMFVIEGLGLVPEEIRVVSVVPTDKHLFEITGLIHDSNKYARVEQGLSIPPEPTSLWPEESSLPIPANLEVEESVYLEGPTATSKATISWQQGLMPSQNVVDPRVTYFEIEFIDPDSDVADWQPLGVTSNLHYDLKGTESGTYQFRVRARDNKFRSSPYLERDFLLESLLLPPDDVTTMNGFVTGESMQLEFTGVSNVDLDHYEVRYSPRLTGVTWAEAQTVSGNVPALATMVLVPSAVGTYMIKAVDQQGHFSDNPASFTSTIASIFEYNVIQTLVEDDPNWTGTFTNVVEIEDDPLPSGTFSLYLEDGETLAGWTSMAEVTTLAEGVGGITGSGAYEFGNKVDLGEIYNARVTFDMQVGTFTKGNTLDTWTKLSDLNNLAQAVENETNVILQVSVSDLSVVNADIAGDTGDQTTGWGNYTTLILNNYNTRSYKFRILMTTTNSNVSPVVNNCSIIFDMADRTLTNNAVEVSSNSADTLIRFTNHGGDFFGPTTPSVSLGIENLAVGEFGEITNINTAGFDFNVRDNLGARVVRNFHWIAKGYGTVQ